MLTGELAMPKWNRLGGPLPIEYISTVRPDQKRSTSKALAASIGRRNAKATSGLKA